MGDNRIIVHVVKLNSMHCFSKKISHLFPLKNDIDHCLDSTLYRAISQYTRGNVSIRLHCIVATLVWVCVHVCVRTPVC